MASDGTTKKLRSDFPDCKVNVQAEIQLIGTHDDICVCEVLDLACVPSQRNNKSSDGFE